MLATAPADSAETFTVAQRTACAVRPWGWRAVARPSTRAQCSFTLNRAMGINSTKPRSTMYTRAVNLFSPRAHTGSHMHELLELS